MATFQVDIVSAEGEIYSGEAAMLFAPARLGEVGIAPRHAPLLTTLRPGEVRIQPADGGEERSIYITGGLMEVQPHLVIVLANSAMHGDQLDEAAALQAKQRAEELLRDRPAGMDLAQAQEVMIEAAARYQAAQKLKTRR